MTVEERKQLSQYLAISWKAAKLYEKICSIPAKKYGLTKCDKDVLLFLHNNENLDTASDIVKYRSISKSLVCKSVNDLTVRGLLRTEPDQDDSRRVHLQITSEGQPIAVELRHMQDQFFTLLSEGISAEEHEAFFGCLQKITRNINEYMED